MAKRPGALTPKQRLFVAEYPKDFNGTAAAVRAGCSEKSAKVTASRWLTKANVQDAIAKAMKRRNEKAEIDAKWVLYRLIRNSKRAEAANKFSAVNRALEIISRHTGGFSEKHEHTGSGGGPIQTQVLRVVRPAGAAPVNENGFLERHALNGSHSQD